MNAKTVRNIVEALLLSSDKPLNIQKIQQCFEEWERPDKSTVVHILESLQEEYASKGIELVSIANAWRIQARSEYAQWLVRLNEEKPPRYSRAVLETLAIIVYKQPVTRADIENIRGVSVSSNVMKSLLDREWIKVAGYRDVPGKPAVYVTTNEFLQYFNLSSLKDLPTLRPIESI